VDVGLRLGITSTHYFPGQEVVDENLESKATFVWSGVGVGWEACS